jgi:hypothetical protein
VSNINLRAFADNKKYGIPKSISGKKVFSIDYREKKRLSIEALFYL